MFCTKHACLGGGDELCRSLLQLPNRVALFKIFFYLFELSGLGTAMMESFLNQFGSSV